MPPLSPFLAGRYRLGKAVGVGGMGNVFAAEDVVTGRSVAIKRLNPVLAADPAIRTRFNLEAQAAARIEHPGMVEIFDTGTDEQGVPYFVMELLTGETLGTRLKRDGSLPIGEAVDLISDVLETLAAAHRANIVHRDLKADNVFLVAHPAGTIKILDFGISKFRGAADADLSVTRSGVTMGTPLYMAPEQMLRPREVGPAADLFSIGVLLYEAITGRTPFGGDSYPEVTARVLKEPHQPLDTVRPDVPPALSAIVDRLLAKSSQDRPSDALEARSALRLAMQPDASRLNVDPLSATRVGMPNALLHQPAPRPARRVFAWGLFFAVAVAGVAAVAIPLRRPANSVTRITGRSAEPSARPAVSPIVKSGAPPAKPRPVARLVPIVLDAQPTAARWSVDGQEMCGPACEYSGREGATPLITLSADGYQTRVERLPPLVPPAGEDKKIRLKWTLLRPVVSR